MKLITRGNIITYPYIKVKGRIKMYTELREIEKVLNERPDILELIKLVKDKPEVIEELNSTLRGKNNEHSTI